MNDPANIPPGDSPTQDHDRHWQAFLYVSGEMSPAEAEEFEAQLADDQTAREAVADAVQLLATMAASVTPAATEITATPQSIPQSRHFAALVTVAALVLVCLSLIHLRQSGRDNSPARELVSLWAESQSLTDDSVEADGASNGEDEDLTVPGWMLAAVETDTGKKAEGD
jgi:ferric-dicitrate binding protein FerR (iron transport regulator)